LPTGKDSSGPSNTIPVAPGAMELAKGAEELLVCQLRAAEDQVNVSMNLVKELKVLNSNLKNISKLLDETCNLLQENLDLEEEDDNS
jgi:hypothetical protein